MANKFIFYLLLLHGVSKKYQNIVFTPFIPKGSELQKSAFFVRITKRTKFVLGLEGYGFFPFLPPKHSNFKKSIHPETIPLSKFQHFSYWRLGCVLINQSVS